MCNNNFAGKYISTKIKKMLLAVYCFVVVVGCNYYTDFLL